MLYFESMIHQAIKHNQIVCGDTTVELRNQEGSYFAIFDGIGSGIYANIAATEAANRWLGMVEQGLSFSESCEIIAASMNKARTDESPFAAFIAVKVAPGGHAIIYNYEAPKPVVYRNRLMQVLEPHYYTTGYEIVGESHTHLEVGDELLIFSDGVAQAGLGMGYHMGWGEKAVSDFFLIHEQLPRKELLQKISDHCKKISGDEHADDTTLMLIRCRPAKHLSLFTGPPSSKEKDDQYAADFLKAKGDKIICGSTSTDILSRELKREVKLLEQGMGYHSPPEYAMEGATMVTEGALVLNQVTNILDAGEELGQGTSPERLAKLILRADVIYFYIGNARNDAHQSLIFRQLGIRPRGEILKLLTEKLTAMGKLLRWKYY